MKSDNLKFLLSMLAVLVLVVGVVYSGYLRDTKAGAGPTVDLDKIEALYQRGAISLHEASHWERVEETK